MITLVMMNWKRPHNVVEYCKRYSKFDIFSKIICFNNSAPIEWADELSGKVVSIESSRDLGLYSRLAAASLARTEAILHLDDDIFLPIETIDELYKLWLGAPKSVHGVFGRDVRNGYLGHDVFGEVEVVLTRAAICSREVNNFALFATTRFDDLSGRPHGNGEDIILSFAAMRLSQTKNFAYKLTHDNYFDPGSQADDIAIHRRWGGHYQHREAVVSRCRQIFPELCSPGPQVG